MQIIISRSPQRYDYANVTRDGVRTMGTIVWGYGRSDGEDHSYKYVSNALYIGIRVKY